MRKSSWDRVYAFVDALFWELDENTGFSEIEKFAILYYASKFYTGNLKGSELSEVVQYIDANFMAVMEAEGIVPDGCVEGRAFHR